MLEVKNVTKRYANHTALDDVSLLVPQGTVYGLLGPNGAGKTTLIRIINRITAPDSGEIWLDGKPMTQEDIYHIGYLPEERGLYKKMKVGEQALYFAQLKGMPRREAAEKLKSWFKRFEIREWWDKKVEELSKGMAQKVQFIVTVLHEPKLLIFDEPFSGFDPINANILKEEILRLKDGGATVIFSTHNMASVEEICDNITLINKSKNILTGNVDRIRHRYGENTFRLDFTGSKPELLQKLREKGIPVTDDAGTALYSSLRIKMPEGPASREILALVNETVEIRNFTEIIPQHERHFHPGGGRDSGLTRNGHATALLSASILLTTEKR